jgi:hypothetical protein
MDTVVVIEMYESLYRGNRFTISIVHVAVEFILIPKERQHGYGRIRIREENYHAEEKTIK